jgi:hypothetical protein
MAVDLNARAYEFHAAHLEYGEDTIGAAILVVAQTVQAWRFVAGSVC